MDPFAGLPIDVQLQMLESLPDLHGARKLSQASSSLFRQFQAFKNSIGLRYVRRHYDDMLIQDAVAILAFPRAPDELDKAKHYSNVYMHLCRWGEKRLSDPTKPLTFDVHMMFQLEAMYCWIWHYIDDYLSKATSDFLPRAYRRLPKWSVYSHLPQQLELQHEAKSFERNTLSPEQQYRLSKAFLRYELLCRVYGPHGNDLNFMEYNAGHWRGRERGRSDSGDGNQHVSESRHGQPVPCENLFRHWDWTLLNKFEEGNESPSELELLVCVREYFKTLYGVLISGCSRLDIPSVSTNWSHPEFEVALPNHNGYHVQPPNYAGVPSLLGPVFDDNLVSLVASAGLDIVTNLLTAGKREGITRELVEDMCQFPPCGNMPGIAWSINNSSGFWGYEDYAHGFFILYRQRAWPLFAQSRPGPGLPTEKQYIAAYRSGWPCKRQSRMLPTSSSIGNELIRHGAGIWTSRAMQLLKTTPFWRIPLPG